MVTFLAGTKFYGGGHPWSGLDPARLGSKAPWRSGVRREDRRDGRRQGRREGRLGRRGIRSDP
jgi:hypothetical protein